MRRAQLTLRHADAEVARAVGDPLGQHGETLHDGCRAPFGHHLHADCGHLHRYEMVALAHVEAPRIGDIAEI